MEEDLLSTPVHLVSLAARGLARLNDGRLKQYGFGVGQLAVLIALKNGKARSQKDLTRLARIEQPGMAQMLNRMERDGLIDRVPDPNDGRSSRITLTELAEEKLSGAIGTFVKGNREVLAVFTDKEADRLITLLTRLILRLDDLNGGPQAG